MHNNPKLNVLRQQNHVERLFGKDPPPPPPQPPAAAETRAGAEVSVGNTTGDDKLESAGLTSSCAAASRRCRPWS